MATFMKNQNNEHISDALYQLVREEFEESQSIVISESGALYEHDFDHDSYYEKFSFEDMVTYLINNRY